MVDAKELTSSSSNSESVRIVAVSSSQSISPALVRRFLPNDRFHDSGSAGAPPEGESGG
jgi:hypothetical protein